MGRWFLVMACAVGAAGVILGAFGAHGLKARLTPELLEVWQTAVQYHLWHALALLATGILLLQAPHVRWLEAAGWTFLAGILVFSGSLYLMAVTGWRGLGAVTPFGGLALIAAWTMLGVGAWRSF